MMKIAINQCYGGFQISLECAYHMALHGHFESKIAVLEYEWVSYFNMIEESNVRKPYYWYGYFIYPNEQRTDPFLIEAIEYLGEKASADLSDITIVEIPDNVQWYIDDYDDRETVHEMHRIWS